MLNTKCILQIEIKNNISTQQGIIYIYLKSMHEILTKKQNITSLFGNRIDTEIRSQKFNVGSFVSPFDTN